MAKEKPILPLALTEFVPIFYRPGKCLRPWFGLCLAEQLVQDVEFVYGTKSSKRRYGFFKINHEGLLCVSLCMFNP